MLSRAHALLSLSLWPSYDACRYLAGYISETSVTVIDIIVTTAFTARTDITLPSAPQNKPSQSPALSSPSYPPLCATAGQEPFPIVPTFPVRVNRPNIRHDGAPERRERLDFGIAQWSSVWYGLSKCVASVVFFVLICRAALGACLINLDLILHAFPRWRSFDIRESTTFLAASLSLSFGVMVRSMILPYERTQTADVEP
jgi:hypothetical protein